MLRAICVVYTWRTFGLCWEARCFANILETEERAEVKWAHEFRKFPNLRTTIYLSHSALLGPKFCETAFHVIAIFHFSIAPYEIWRFDSFQRKAFLHFCMFHSVFGSCNTVHALFRLLSLIFCFFWRLAMWWSLGLLLQRLAETELTREWWNKRTRVLWRKAR